VGSVGRWLHHPHPVDGECLSSWLSRLAASFSLQPQELLEHYLGSGGLTPDDLDIAPAAQLLVELHDRTGVELERLTQMTAAGLPLWRMPAGSKSEVKSVLLPPTIPIDVIQPGSSPWVGRPLLHRRCPACLAENPGAEVPLAWRLPIVLTCEVHRCALVWGTPNQRWGTFHQARSQHVAPSDDAVLLQDARTYTALGLNELAMQNGTLAATTWFSFFYRVLDELISVPFLLHVPPASRARLGLEYADRAASGRQPWRQFENLERDRQRSTLVAAARVVRTIETGELRPPGASPVLSVLVPTATPLREPSIFLTHADALMEARRQIRTDDSVSSLPDHISVSSPGWRTLREELAALDRTSIDHQARFARKLTAWMDAQEAIAAIPFDLDQFRD
jgi:hypothetical protein